MSVFRWQFAWGCPLVLLTAGHREDGLAAVRAGRLAAVLGRHALFLVVLREDDARDGVELRLEGVRLLLQDLVVLFQLLDRVPGLGAEVLLAHDL